MIAISSVAWSVVDLGALLASGKWRGAARAYEPRRDSWPMKLSGGGGGAGGGLCMESHQWTQGAVSRARSTLGSSLVPGSARDIWSVTRACMALSRICIIFQRGWKCTGWALYGYFGGAGLRTRPGTRLPSPDFDRSHRQRPATVTPARTTLDARTGHGPRLRPRPASVCVATALLLPSTCHYSGARF